MTRKHNRIVHPALAAALLVLVGMTLLGACGGKPQVYVQQYVFSYAPPSPAGKTTLAAAIKVQRFGALPQFSSQKNDL